MVSQVGFVAPITKAGPTAIGVPSQYAVSPHIAHPLTGGPRFVNDMPPLRSMPKWARDLGLSDGRQALVWDSG